MKTNNREYLRALGARMQNNHKQITEKEEKMIKLTFYNQPIEKK